MEEAVQNLKDAGSYISGIVNIIKGKIGHTLRHIHA
jgi:hypothetical protein